MTVNQNIQSGGKTKARLPCLVRVLGGIITVASICFVFFEIYHSKVWVDSASYSIGFLGVILLSSAIYTFNGFILAVAWCRIIYILGAKSNSRFRLISMFGRAQIARYAPGNVFHIVGRHVLVTQAGVTHAKAIASTALEFGCILAAAFIITLIGLPMTNLQGVEIPFDYGLFLLVGSLIFVIVVGVVARKRNLIQKYKNIIKGSGKNTWLPLVTVVLLYGSFFLLSGLVLFLLLGHLENSDSNLNFASIVTLVAASWTVGFITPGAPGGIGVREAVLIVFLSPVFGVETSTLASISFRIVTVFGEIALFLICYTLIPIVEPKTSKNFTPKD